MLTGMQWEIASERGPAPCSCSVTLQRRTQHRCISVISDAFGPLPPRQHRRVVVTGLGIVSPLGTAVPETWQAILQGVSGIRALQPEDLPEVTASSWQLRAVLCLAFSNHRCRTPGHKPGTRGSCSLPST